MLRSGVPVAAPLAAGAAASAPSTAHFPQHAPPRSSIANSAVQAELHGINSDNGQPSRSDGTESNLNPSDIGLGDDEWLLPFVHNNGVLFNTEEVQDVVMQVMGHPESWEAGVFTDVNENDSDVFTDASANEHLATAEMGSEWIEQNGLINSSGWVPSVVTQPAAADTQTVPFQQDGTVVETTVVPQPAAANLQMVPFLQEHVPDSTAVAHTAVTQPTAVAADMQIVPHGQGHVTNVSDQPAAADEEVVDCITYLRDAVTSMASQPDVQRVSFRALAEDANFREAIARERQARDRAAAAGAAAAAAASSAATSDAPSFRRRAKMEHDAEEPEATEEKPGKKPKAANKQEPLIIRVARKILGNLTSLAFGLGAAAQAVLGGIVSKFRALLRLFSRQSRSKQPTESKPDTHTEGEADTSDRVSLMSVIKTLVRVLVIAVIAILVFRNWIRTAEEEKKRMAELEHMHALAMHLARNFGQPGPAGRQW